MSTRISPATQRKNDIKLLSIVSVIVLLCGFFIAGTILFLTKGDAPGPCGKVNAGSLSDLVPRAAISPNFVVFGGNCQFWVALRDSRLVAVKPTIAKLGCRIDWKPSADHFFCDDRQVTFAQLDYYPAAVGTGAFKGSWIVDFGDSHTAATTIPTT
jgi:hypothetical protein